MLHEKQPILAALFLVSQATDRITSRRSKGGEPLILNP
jgi:hypothetical protein